MINKFNPIVHISTGDLLRDHVKKSTPVGLKAKGFMDTGKLVPDEIVIEMVKERLKQDDVKKHGYMFDGYPRTLEQAKALDKVTKLNVVAVIDIDKDTLKKRILGRVNCPKCNRIYSTNNPKLMPKVAGKCDDCKEILIHRADDNEETFEKRWNTYQEQSVDVIKYYEKRKGLVRHIDSLTMLDIPEKELKKMLSLK